MERTVKKKKGVLKKKKKNFDLARKSVEKKEQKKPRKREYCVKVNTKCSQLCVPLTIAGPKAQSKKKKKEPSTLLR